MKVLHLSGSVNHWSGNEQQLSDLIQNLNKLGVKNTIFCYENSAIEAYAKKEDITYYPQKVQSIYSYKLAKSLKKVINENNIDVIHVHTSNFLTVYMVSDILFSLKIPTIFSRKGFSEKSSFLSALKYNYKNVHRTICISKAVKQGMMNFVSPKNHDKLVVIYDGISTEKINNPNIINIRSKYAINDDKIIIGNIANHGPAKDLFTFIKTADYLINNLNITNIHFVQIGQKTALTKELNNLVDNLKLNDFITFTDKIDNAKKIISQFDIFLMPSKSEGGPLTIYESFLYKIPVVSTKVGIAEEAITDNENGFLCNIGDHKCLASKIKTLIDKPDLKNHFTNISYSILHDKFDSKICAERTLNQYKTITK